MITPFGFLSKKSTEVVAQVEGWTSTEENETFSKANIPGPNRYLIFHINAEAISGGAGVDNAYYGGVRMTRLTDCLAKQGWNTTQQFGLDEIGMQTAVGTAFTWDNKTAGDPLNLAACVFENVDQNEPIKDTQSSAPIGAIDNGDGKTDGKYGYAGKLKMDPGCMVIGSYSSSGGADFVDYTYELLNPDGEYTEMAVVGQDPSKGAYKLYTGATTDVGKAGMGEGLFERVASSYVVLNFAGAPRAEGWERRYMWNCAVGGQDQIGVSQDFEHWNNSDKNGSSLGEMYDNASLQGRYNWSVEAFELTTSITDTSETFGTDVGSLESTTNFPVPAFDNFWENNNGASLEKIVFKIEGLSPYQEVTVRIANKGIVGGTYTTWSVIGLNTVTETRDNITVSEERSLTVTANALGEIEIEHGQSTVAERAIICGFIIEFAHDFASPEVRQALAYYDTSGESLPRPEVIAMQKYIDAEVLVGNHAKKDYDVIFSLGGTSNSLVDYIKGTAATAVGSPLHSVTYGYDFNGSGQWILLNYHATNDSIKFTENDGQSDAFHEVSGITPTQWRTLFSASSVPNWGLFERNTTTISWYGNTTAYLSDTSHDFINNTLYSLKRVIGSNELQYLENGAVVGFGTLATTGIPNSEMYVGTYDAGTNNFIGKVSSFSIGAIYTDQIARNTNLRALLVELGTIDYSTEALAAFSNYTTYGDGLTLEEKLHVSAYIDSEVAIGNHQKKDFEVLLFLSGDNSLVDYIGGTVCTTVGSPTHSTSYGYEFSGTQRILTGWVPDTDGVNYTLNDSQVDAFHMSGSDPSGFDSLLASLSSTGGYADRVWLAETNTFVGIYAGINGIKADQTEPIEYAGGYFKDETLYGVARDSSSSIELLGNGIVLEAKDPSTSTALNDVEIAIGAWATGEDPFNGKIATATFGAKSVDQAARTANLKTLLRKLKVITYSAEALAAFANYDTYGTGLTLEEKRYVSEFIDAEVVVGNHQKKDFEVILCLSRGNSLVDYIGGTVCALANDSTTDPIHDKSYGYDFDGTNRIDTGWSPGGDGVNYTQDDAQADAFHVTSDAADDVNRTLFGAITAPWTGLLSIQEQRWDLGVYWNTNGVTNGEAPEASFFADNTLYSTLRSDSANHSYWEGGVLTYTEARASSAIIDQQVSIGGWFDSVHHEGMKGKIASFSAGAVYADQVARNTNLRTLLTKLGVI